MPHYVFLTGKLAEPALRRVLAGLAPAAGFEYTVAVLPITVAALATTPWIARHFTPRRPSIASCSPAFAMANWTCCGKRGASRDRKRPGRPARSAGLLRHKAATASGLRRATTSKSWPRSTTRRACRWTRSGEGRSKRAPTGPTSSIWAAIRARAGPASPRRSRRCAARGCASRSTASIRSRRTAAAEAGAELVLSVNASNRAAARRLGLRGRRRPRCAGRSARGWPKRSNSCKSMGVPFRIDPVLEPIAFGFAASLGRYLEVRKRLSASSR